MQLPEHFFHKTYLQNHHIKHAKMQNLGFCPYTGEYGSVETRTLAYIFYAVNIFFRNTCHSKHKK